MADQAALLRALRSFATRSVEDYELSVVLDEVNRHAIRVLGLDGAGITLTVASRTSPMQHIAATDVKTLHVEQEQDRLQQGACIDATHSGKPVHVADIESVDRWPA